MSDQFYRALERNLDGEWHVLDRRQKVVSTHRHLDDAIARIATVGRAWEETAPASERKDMGWAFRELQRVALEMETPIGEWMKGINSSINTKRKP